MEEKAKNAVAEILHKTAEGYPESQSARVPLSSDWGGVASSTFDHAWLSGLNASVLELNNLANGIDTNKCKNGKSIRVSASIRPRIGVDGGTLILESGFPTKPYCDREVFEWRSMPTAAL